MPSTVRPRGSASSSRPVPTITPMSERQQMALLMQMTSSNLEAGSRSPTGSSARSRDRNERGETPLHLAAIKGDVEQVSRLLAGRADPNVVDFAEWTPLHEACNHGWYDVAYKLISCGASVNAKGLDNETPLHDAVNNCHQKLVKLLVERGADIYAKNSKGKSPFDNAVPQIAAILLNPSSPICDTGPSRLQPRLRDEKKLVDSSSTSGSSSITSSTLSSSGNKQRAASAEDNATNTTIPVTDTNSKGISTSCTSATALSISSTSQSASSAVDDIYEFKSVKESDSPTDLHRKTPSTDPLELDKDAVDPLSLPISPGEGDEKELGKRTFSEMESGSTIANTDEITAASADDDGRRKKRKDDCNSNNSSNKDIKSNAQQQSQRSGSAGSGVGASGSSAVSSNKAIGKIGIGLGKSSALAGNAQKSPGNIGSAEKKSPVASPKSTSANSDPEPDNDNNSSSATIGKTDLKVPPLKIVIPSQNHGTPGCEPETTLSRNGKNSGTRGHHHHHHHHQALPYVVSTGGGGGNSSGSSTASAQTSNATSTLTSDGPSGGTSSSSITTSSNTATGGSNNTSGCVSGQVVATATGSGDKDKDKDGGSGVSCCVGGTTSPTEGVTGGKSTVGGNVTDDGKGKDGGGNGNCVDDQRGHHQRVLRSSHRSGGATGTGTVDRSNNSSPQLQHRSHSPSPNSSPAAPTPPEMAPITVTGATSQAIGLNMKAVDMNMHTSNSSDSEPSVTPPAPTTVSTSISSANACNTNTNNNSNSNSVNASSATNNNNINSNGNNATTAGGGISSSGAAANCGPATPTVELHPRKRKMKPSKESVGSLSAASAGGSSGSGGGGTTTGGNGGGGEATESAASSELHPHEQPIMNCYQLFLNIRKQIDKRRKGLFPVQPKPPQGFKDYLMNRCSYVLSGTAPTTPNINFPSTLPPPMKDIFTEQEKERYRLRMQHVIEKEKLVLSVEQEILRVHGRAARALANQSLPFSVCTILRDEEVYNLITPEQEEKDRNARSRYNGRLFLSWLQDVDDKWEKIKEHMLLRHHNEAESLHAVQKMNWEWKMKELILCDAKSTPSIDELHVPMVHVSDDFDLLPT